MNTYISNCQCGNCIDTVNWIVKVCKTGYCICSIDSQTDGIINTKKCTQNATLRGEMAQSETHHYQLADMNNNLNLASVNSRKLTNNLTFANYQLSKMK